jgi:signal peptidase I
MPMPEANDVQSPSRSRVWLREGARLAAFVVALAAARSSLADHYHVPTGSMIPTVEIGDRVLVNKLAYGLRVPFTGGSLFRLAGPARGDVVVLESPEDGVTLLKRVVAVPGDTVEVHGGQLRINGTPVPVEHEVSAAQGGDGDRLIERLGTHPHRLRITRGGGYDYPPTQVGADEYLVMGDNRGDSHDGRAFGLVHRQAIFGRALSVWLRGGRLTWQGL